MRKADITQGSGFRSVRGFPGERDPASSPAAQTYARKGMGDKSPNSQPWQRNWNANSVMVRNLQELERRINWRNEAERGMRQMQVPPLWELQPQQPQYRQQQHQLPVGAAHYPQAQMPTRVMAQPMAFSGFQQPPIRPEADVVNHVLNVLQIPMADPRLSVNFAQHPEGYTENARKLNIEFSNPQELNRAHAALSNIRQEIRLSNGERANIQSVASGPSIPGQSSQVDIYVTSQSGQTGRLVVSMANSNLSAHGGLSSVLPVRQHPGINPILRQPNAAPRNAGLNQHVRFA